MHHDRRLYIELKSPRAKSRAKASTALWEGIDLAAAFKATGLDMPLDIDVRPGADATGLCRRANG